MLLGVVSCRDKKVGFTPIEINYPLPLTYDSIDVPEPDPDHTWEKEFRIRYGDTFLGILKKLKLSPKKISALNPQINALINYNEFQVGQIYRVIYDKGFQPIQVIYEANPLRPLHINIKTERVYYIERKIDIAIKVLKAPIEGSLAKTVIEAGAPENLSDKILSVLAWEIDFRNLKRGDSFEVMYEQASVDSQAIGCENIRMLKFQHQGETYTAYGFDAGNGWEYFNAQGHNMSHAPLQFEMITSLYAQKRFHPVRRRWRAHYGMDFEAEEGTPIEAIQDGIITRAKYMRANGNNVKIQHSKDLTTQYLHLSKIDTSIHVGDSIKRGEVIGFVGSTGWSSGPHLCLRVWYKGSQRDPLNFDFPRRADVPNELMDAFKSQIQTYQQQLSE